MGVGLDFRQFYFYEIDVTNIGEDGDLDAMAIWDTVRDQFQIEPNFERQATEGECPNDGICDGISFSPDCPATVDGPAKKATNPSARFVVIEPVDGFEAGRSCATRVYVGTIDDSGKKRKSEIQPDKCQSASTPDGSNLNNTIQLNDGAKIFDVFTNELLSGPTGAIQLTPVDCL